MAKKSFYIFTYGCQMNKNDSEIMAGMLINECNYDQSAKPDKADILIFNTCAVRNKAEQRAFSRIREFNGLRKKNKSQQLLILAGCIPQYEKENIFKEFPYLDLVIGTNTLEFLPQYLLNKQAKNTIKIEESKNTKQSATQILRSSKDQAWIPIMYGCNNFCSYCIVPHTRGREVSRKKEEILTEIEKLKAGSYKEIVLLGQNVNSYGANLYTDYDFADLLEDVHRFDFLKTINFLTSHPKDISLKLIQTIARLPQIGREIHFPLQAGDDEILQKMNRGYTFNDYKKLTLLIQKWIPDAKISTDLIVGFPGETDDQFKNTIKAVKELGFFRVNTAAYSPRKGTAAASMENQHSEKIKHERLLLLLEAVSKYAFNKD
ncbi:MAG: tRNA (N6-isopentenyl adenosine(37)-C2)-methylthiotransferase MiaB [Candidatus Margulisbacteria bacterium GWF2_35_9]|nr:MAG: tRNA (N6-isopentenyl adenosine(37)-C2)-methylthiotransferase MiaB [Candidatus Margulisbacteria bacterium GWF2_35_9]